MEVESLSELSGECDADIWQQIVENTVSYYCYIKALKNVGIPRLKSEMDKESMPVNLERWTKKDQKHLDGLQMSCDYFDEVSPLEYRACDQDELYNNYAESMKVFEINKFIEMLNDTMGDQ